MQELRSRLERERVLSLAGVSPAAQSFLVFALSRAFPMRSVVAITDGVKTQESFQQDIETWFSLEGNNSLTARQLYFPSWEILPHESKLPHADVISERLQAMVALGQGAERSEERRVGKECSAGGWGGRC